MASPGGETAAKSLILFSLFVVLPLRFGQRFIGKLFIVAGAHPLRFCSVHAGDDMVRFPFAHVLFTSASSLRRNGRLIPFLPLQGNKMAVRWKTLFTTCTVL
jgi:hypothetical protein